MVVELHYKSNNDSMCIVCVCVSPRVCVGAHVDEWRFDRSISLLFMFLVEYEIIYFFPETRMH